MRKIFPIARGDRWRPGRAPRMLLVAPMRVSSAPDTAPIPRWRLSIRAHLVVLVLAALLPVLLFATVLVVYRAREERAAIENGMRDTARALATAVDRELVSSITALRAFAASQHLES